MMSPMKDTTLRSAEQLGMTIRLKRKEKGLSQNRLAELLGRVRADEAGRLSLDYEASWIESPHGHSLSVSMPLAQITYPHKPVLSYLWNLLPENPNVLQRWGQQYHVSGANPFKLLAHVGADLPGAAQFIPPERLEEIQC